MSLTSFPASMIFLAMSTIPFIAKTFSTRATRLKSASAAAKRTATVAELCEDHEENVGCRGMAWDLALWMRTGSRGDHDGVARLYGGTPRGAREPSSWSAQPEKVGSGARTGQAPRPDVSGSTKGVCFVLAERGIATAAATQRLLEHSSPQPANDVYTHGDPVLRQAIGRLPVAEWV
jgi:hypothetical protein